MRQLEGVYCCYYCYYCRVSEWLLGRQSSPTLVRRLITQADRVVYLSWTN
jgi:hypothetical protein